MLKLLVTADGSDNADRVVDYVIKQASMYKEPVEVHLLNVQMPLGGANVKRFISRKDLEDYYQEEGMAALKRAREKLDVAAIKYAYHIGVGDPAEVIVAYAKAKDCQQIVMGTRGMGTVSNLVLGSVATKAIHLSDKIPVLLIK